MNSLLSIFSGSVTEARHNACIFLNLHLIFKSSGFPRHFNVPAKHALDVRNKFQFSLLCLSHSHRPRFLFYFLDRSRLVHVYTRVYIRSATFILPVAPGFDGVSTGRSAQVLLRPAGAFTEPTAQSRLQALWKGD